MHIYGLLGKKLSHSFSRDYFTDKFIEYGLKNYEYRNFEIDKIIDFERIKKDTEIKGLNVTMPYKQAIMPFLSQISEEAKAIGAVNTIVIYQNKTMGFNTDVIGFEKIVKPYLSLNDKKALILGNGGAAKAVAYVLQKQGFEFDFAVRKKTNSKIHVLYSEIKDLSYYNIIVNATPLGMFPYVNTCPLIEYSQIKPSHVLIDLVYNPVETLFLKKGKAHKAFCVNGLEMLYAQADAAWNIWQRQL